jgi:hypothetical protein
MCFFLVASGPFFFVLWRKAYCPEGMVSRLYVVEIPAATWDIRTGCRCAISLPLWELISCLNIFLRHKNVEPIVPFFLNSSLFFISLLLPIFSFSFCFLPFSFLFLPCLKNIFHLFLFPFSYFCPKMTLADTPPLGEGYFPIYRPQATSGPNCWRM